MYSLHQANNSKRKRAPFNIFFKDTDRLAGITVAIAAVVVVVFAVETTFITLNMTINCMAFQSIPLRGPK